jgi:hypothetical protein
MKGEEISFLIKTGYILDTGLFYLSTNILIILLKIPFAGLFPESANLLFCAFF